MSDEPTDDKSTTVGVKMSVAERERIRQAASKLGIGLSTYLRMAALERAKRDE